MWWLVTLLVLALLAFFIVKSMKASTQNRQVENNQLQNEALTASSSAQAASTADSAEDSASSGSPSVAQQAGAVAAVAATAGVAANAAANAGQTSDRGTSDSRASESNASVQTGDHLADVREMIKILNLDGPDASRLGISREELTALRKGQSAGTPDAASLENVATKLRQMMA